MSVCVIGEPVAGTSGKRRFGSARAFNRSARCWNNSFCCGKGNASTANSISASVLTAANMAQVPVHRQVSGITHCATYLTRVIVEAQEGFGLPSFQLTPVTDSFCAAPFAPEGSVSVRLCMCWSRRGFRFVPPA